MNSEQGMSYLEGQKFHHSLFLVQYSIFKFKNNISGNPPWREGLTNFDF
ncbi:MAG: hypothetical protein WC209_05080 [Ignavibacteriaceae bacterium]